MQWKCHKLEQYFNPHEFKNMRRLFNLKAGFEIWTDCYEERYKIEGTSLTQQLFDDLHDCCRSNNFVGDFHDFVEVLDCKHCNPDCIDSDFDNSAGKLDHFADYLHDFVEVLGVDLQFVKEEVQLVVEKWVLEKKIEYTIDKT